MRRPAARGCSGRHRGSTPPTSALPEGVLTLFFSDVEGSTRLAKSRGDVVWAELLETHRALSRQVKGAEMHNGFRSATSGLLYVVYLPLARAALGPDEARRARAEGQAMTLDEAMAYALEGLS